jgi:hypothetical protein
VNPAPGDTMKSKMPRFKTIAITNLKEKEKILQLVAKKKD